jgi:polyhydroxyalkanoate synthesis repressor PhaR
MDRKSVIIKKYENRRLYDTTNSRYINQDEVAQMVRSGYDVQVLDAATGEDLTRLVLTQIIVEQAKAPDSAFPLDVLRQMVVASGKATQETTLKYMKALLDMYQNAYRVMAPPLSPFEFLQRPAAPPEAAPEPPPGSPPPETRESRSPRQRKSKPAGVRELKRRVEELEALVSELGAGKGARKRKTASRRKS